jgi:hypothetical protein
MAVTYPLLVAEKDGRFMQFIENPSQICTLEAVEILNGEYIFWDANGNGVSIAVSVTSFIPGAGDATPRVALPSLGDAFCSNVRTLGLPDFDVDGLGGEVWHRIRKETGARPEKQSFLSRLFR